MEKLEGRKYLPYQVKIGSQSIWMELSSKNSAQILADQINAGISQTHVPRSEAEALRESLSDLRRVAEGMATFMRLAHGKESIHASGSGDGLDHHCMACRFLMDYEAWQRRNP